MSKMNYEVFIFFIANIEDTWC